ncbi:MAG TPA: hypothetical protein VFB76_05770 [Candidatus Angelobacter sp.]|nr:hypothetical protein [Candidatus Angelobacter sp.]
MLTTLAGAQSWTPLTHQPSFGAGTTLLLTDGTVMVQDSAFGSPNHWWRLKPDSSGSYVNGAWTQLASLPSGYDPLYYASAVLPDGRVVIAGGEYNLGSQVESGMAAIYNPQTNVWTSFSAPWSQTGDAQSAVLPNGTFMVGNCCNNQQALLNASTLAWTYVGLGKADSNSEEGWTLLPANVDDGGVFTVDVSLANHVEIYDPVSQNWSTTANTPPAPLVTCSEIGPAVLRPDGTIFATGATSNTGIYNPFTNHWTAGPSFPAGLGVVDGPAALLPNGNVLVDAAPIGCNFPTGSRFFEFNGTSLTEVARPPRASVDPSFVGRMLVLPTGQVLFTDGSSDVEIYTPTGTFNFVWQPTINSYPANITIGASWYQILGTQLNGLSQGAMYGDDAQSATNYPLVRITNNATHHVFYAFTHDHSTMAVQTGGVQVSTLFDPPLNMERGPSTLVVVTNGIPSAPVQINVF